MSLNSWEIISQFKKKKKKKNADGVFSILFVFCYLLAQSVSTFKPDALWYHRLGVTIRAPDLIFRLTTFEGRVGNVFMKTNQIYRARRKVQHKSLFSAKTQETAHKNCYLCFNGRVTLISKTWPLLDLWGGWCIIQNTCINIYFCSDPSNVFMQRYINNGWRIIYLLTFNSIIRSDISALQQ